MQAVDFTLPFQLRLLSRVDSRHTHLSQPFQDVHDPIALRLRDAGSVGVRRGRLRTIQKPEIRKARDRHAVRRESAEFPLLVESLAVQSRNVHILETAGETVEAGGEGDDVEFVLDAV